MTDLKRLNAVIAESGITKVAIAQKTGILRATLYNKLDGKSEFTAREIMLLCKALGISKRDRDAIFFAGEVELNTIS